MFGTLASHDCNEGFALVGALIRICTSENGTTGVWSGDPSACEGKLNSKYIVEYKCITNR